MRAEHWLWISAILALVALAFFGKSKTCQGQDGSLVNRSWLLGCPTGSVDVSGNSSPADSIAAQSGYIGPYSSGYYDQIATAEEHPTPIQFIT